MLVKLRKYFLSGLVTFLPAALTVYLFIFILNKADGILGKFIEPYFLERFGFYYRGIGIVFAIYFIVLIGFLMTNYLGRRIHDFFEKLLIRLPFFRQVYPAVKEMAIVLFSRDSMKSFNSVAIVEYPRKGIYTVGFMTNDASEKICTITKKQLCNIFIPTSPSPLTGFVVLVPKEEVILPDITVEEAFKFIVSAGVVNPENVKGIGKK